MKKALAIVLALVLCIGLTACSAPKTAEPTTAPTEAPAAGYEGEIKVWVAENMVELTQKYVDQFKAANEQYAKMTVTIEAVGEGDAANKMITDVQSGADIFGFAQDQLARLVAASALVDMLPENAEVVKAQNDAASVAAATVGETIYAYPMTADNGYFMYYDKSVVTDPTNMEQILKDCEAAGKNVYMQINSGWYQTAFFFGAGNTLTYETNNDGAYISCDCDYASENGVKALKAMIETAKSPVFVNGSSANTATNIGVLVSGVWDSTAVQEALGENYAAAKLPTVGGFQLGGFSGYKLLGVKPQEDEAKLAACDALALYLTSAEVQLARFAQEGWGPSNLEAQADEAVKTNPALVALAAQQAHMVPQGQYPNEYWTLSEQLGDRVLADEFDAMSDEELKAVLDEFQASATSYVVAAE